jgi:hypothetical protein
LLLEGVGSDALYESSHTFSLYDEDTSPLYDMQLADNKFHLWTPKGEVEVMEISKFTLRIQLTLLLLACQHVNRSACH